MARNKWPGTGMATRNGNHRIDQNIAESGVITAAEMARNNRNGNHRINQNIAILQRWPETG